MKAVRQTGNVQGADIRIDLLYANGRVKGRSTTITPEGPKTADVDAVVPAGAIDDNALAFLMPAFPLEPGLRWSVQIVASSDGTVKERVLEVKWTEEIAVPAGKFMTYVIEQTGVQPSTYYVSTTAPYRVIQQVAAGGALRVVLAK